MTREATLARFREYMVGPSRFMTLQSCFELGIVDAIRAEPGITAAKLGAEVGVSPDAVEQLLLLMVKEGFVSHDEAAGTYELDGLSTLDEADFGRALTYMNLIKVVALRQLFYLSDSARTGTVVGLEKLYGHSGTLYGATADHRDLHEAFSTLMDAVTARVDPWFFDNIDVPAGARVLDVAGNTGLGAVHTHRHKASPGLHVTTFDLPEKEAEARETFAAHGVGEKSDFVGGDVFAGTPTGFDVVLIKHFLDMFDRAEVAKILTNVHASLRPGGQVHVLVPVYPEDITDTDNYNVDFFPAFFVGCTMGQGGPQKLSTYKSWLEECGFEVTGTVLKDAAELPPDVIPVQAILSATRAA
jgi:SAM-dependent methyltransferase